MSYTSTCNVYSRNTSALSRLGLAVEKKQVCNSAAEWQCRVGENHLLYTFLLDVIGHNTGHSSPDVFGVLLNGTITGKLPTAGYVVNHHGQPAVLVLMKLRMGQSTAQHR